MHDPNTEGASHGADRLSDILDDAGDTASDKSADTRLSTRLIAAHALEASIRLELLVRGQVTDVNGFAFDNNQLDEAEKLTQAIIMEANAQNDYAVMARHWDARLGKRLENGWRYDNDFDDTYHTDPECLPWICLPEVVRMRQIHFRRTVLALLPAWAGY